MSKSMYTTKTLVISGTQPTFKCRILGGRECRAGKEELIKPGGLKQSAYAQSNQIGDRWLTLGFRARIKDKLKYWKMDHIGAQAMPSKVELPCSLLLLNTKL